MVETIQMLSRLIIITSAALISGQTHAAKGFHNSSKKTRYILPGANALAGFTFFILSILQWVTTYFREEPGTV